MSLHRTLIRSAAALVALVLPAIAAAQSAGTVRVTAERTSIRASAATDGAIVGTAVRGEQLQIIETAGSWYHVRLANGKDGFIHSLFVETAAGASAPPAAAAGSTGPSPQVQAGPPVTSATAPGQPGPSAFAANDPVPLLENRNFGIGLDNVGPSVRYWMGSKIGVQVDGYFSGNAGYSVSAIAPSVLIRFSPAKNTGSLTFLPYWGGGVQLWHFESGYYDYYCGQINECGDGNTIGYGGFVGSDLVFNKYPKFAITGHAGYYSAHLGYGGFGLGLGFHFYPTAKKP